MTVTITNSKGSFTDSSVIDVNQLKKPPLNSKLNDLKINMRELLIGNLGEQNPPKPTPLVIEQRISNQKAPLPPNKTEKQNENKSRFQHEIQVTPFIEKN